MLTFLWILWRIVIPAVGVLFEGACVYGIFDTLQYTSGSEAVIAVGLIIAAMLLIAIIVFLIEGWFWATYRICLPLFMGVIAFIIAMVGIEAIVAGATSDLVGNPVFGSMNFYAVMLVIAVLSVVEALWLALIFVIQGLPDVSRYCLIGGGVLLALALAVTFVYWIIAMLVYFFAHYYKVFFLILGLTLGTVYVGFLVIYAIVKRENIRDIIEDNLDTYWRKA